MAHPDGCPVLSRLSEAVPASRRRSPRRTGPFAGRARDRWRDAGASRRAARTVGRLRTNIRAAFRAGTRDVFAASKSRTAGGTSPPVRREYHSTSWAAGIPRFIPRRRDAGGDDKLPAFRRPRWSPLGVRRGQKVGEPRELGFHQKVRPSRIERQRHAVGLDQRADLRAAGDSRAS